MCANVLHDQLPYSDFRESTLVLYLAFVVCTAVAGPRVVDPGRFPGSEPSVENSIAWPTPLPLRVGLPQRSEAR